MFDGDLLDDDEFPGGVFSDEIDGGRSGAHLRLGDRGITARTSEGREFVIGYSDCDLELGGDSGRMVFCRTADRSLTFFCEDRRFPEALKRAAVGELFEQVDQPVFYVNQVLFVFIDLSSIRIPLVRSRRSGRVRFIIQFSTP